MKALFFVDTHGKPLDKIRKLSRDAEVLVCLGDWTVFESDMKEQLRELNSIGKPVVLIHGNHEDPEDVEMASHGLPNIHFIHKSYFTFKNVIFFGYGGGGFSHLDHKFEILSDAFMKDLAQMEKKSNQSYKLILLTHAPPYGTTLDDMGDSWGHVGSKSIRKFIEKHQPHMAFSGHIHECFNRQDKIRNTFMMNPGPNGIIITL
jgi:uncharacterized protein